MSVLWRIRAIDLLCARRFRILVLLLLCDFLILGTIDHQMSQVQHTLRAVVLLVGLAGACFADIQ
jgi:hypothetical protein